MRKLFVALLLLLCTLFNVLANPYEGGVSLVIVDAGHGGKDPGTESGGTQEKAINLEVAMLLGQELTKRGQKVLLTRTEDVFLELSERCQMANSASFDGQGFPLFISIHVNSAPNKEASGFEVYVKDDAKLVAMASKGTNPLLLSKYASYTPKQLNRYKDIVSRKVAEQIVSSVHKAFPEFRQRGVKEGDLFVVNATWMPSVLIELGFLSNTHDKEMLTNSREMQKMAKAIADAILTF